MSTIRNRGGSHLNVVESKEVVMLKHELASPRRRLGPHSHGYRCTIPGCRTMSFVALKTADGPKGLCLTHFDRLT